MHPCLHVARSSKERKKKKDPPRQHREAGNLVGREETRRTAGGKTACRATGGQRAETQAEGRGEETRTAVGIRSRWKGCAIAGGTAVPGAPHTLWQGD